MKRPEPIELENNLGPDAVTGEINRVPWMAYDVDEMDLYIAEKDKEIAELKKKLMPCLNGDCILTCEVVEKYGKENAELKQKLEDSKASHYAEMVDAGMRERRLKRALYKVCANWAWAEHVRYVDISDGSQGYKQVQERWEKMASKCIKKAREYR